MRIIGGTYRGKKLYSPASTAVRPTADRAREAVFNILNSKLGGDWSSVELLELFTGSGAFALEALSRGVAKVCMADIDLRLLRAVFASGLNVSTVDLMDDSKELSKPENLDADAKLAALPTAHGLNLSIADLQDHANDVVKVALLRGFFSSITYPDHTQADLDGFSVTCNDGPVVLGTGGLNLKVE